MDGSKIAIAVVNRDVIDGFRFLATPEVQTSGETYDTAVAAARGRGLPPRS